LRTRYLPTAPRKEADAPVESAPAEPAPAQD
jgi:hypothetical protein